MEGDLFAPVTGKFDILTSNPPYIPSNVVDSLMPEVRDHEPRMALDGLEDGLFFYRRILAECPPYLHPGSEAYFEIGYDQGQAVSSLMRDSGFSEVRIIQDYAGLDRVVRGIYTPHDGL